jgi:aminocarboxymuconate-semialdehyde decarboxylase
MPPAFPALRGNPGLAAASAVVMDLSPAIDIHSHVVPADFPAYVGRSAAPQWPVMHTTDDCAKRDMMIDGRRFRTIEDVAWDVDRRTAAMDEMGLARQVLSPLPELLSYWLEPNDAERLCRHVNDTIAAMVARAPDHFLALGGVPLQAPDLALRELERLMATGVFRGLEIGTNVNGVPIGDARYAELFAAAEALGAAIFIHPERPIGRERMIGPPVLTNLIGHPCDTSFAVISLITGGILARHPGLRVAVAHGGGAFPIVLPRLEHGWRSVPALREAVAVSPTELARRLYYDSVVYDTEVIDFVISRFGAERVCIGTDIPAGKIDPKLLAIVAHRTAEERNLIRGDNARRWLGTAA